jgi:hypothetical protein
MNDSSSIPAPTAHGAVIADLLEEHGLEAASLSALLLLLEHDGCWACASGAQPPAGAHTHSLPDRALAVWFAALKAKRALRAVLGTHGHQEATGRE